MPDQEYSGLASICAHNHFNPDRKILSHALPIYSTSTFVYESPSKAMAVFRGEEEAYIYSRWANPTVDAVEEKIALLESFDRKLKKQVLDPGAYLFGSGMAAISALFHGTLVPGDKLVTHGNIYGAAVELMNEILKPFGIDTIYEDLHDLNRLESLLKNDPAVKMIYVESPNNPTLDCYDLKSIAELSKKYGKLTAIDNTFASPYLQQPFLQGFDFIVHSTTKYLNGHGTAIGGVLLGRDKDFMKKKMWMQRKLNGGTMSPFDAWLLNNGMVTLPLRMEKHGSNALSVAGYLSEHRSVRKVNYIGLASHPDHEIAKNQMYGFGGVLSFELNGGFEDGVRLMEKIKFCTLTATLGTADTLIQHPASMSHAKVPRSQREKFGIRDGMIRMAIGIEDPEDILSDLDKALK